MLMRQASSTTLIVFYFLSASRSNVRTHFILRSYFSPNEFQLPRDAAARACTCERDYYNDRVCADVTLEKNKKDFLLVFDIFISVCVLCAFDFPSFLFQI